MRRGFVHLYTGNGKGKTTAALGLALRFMGWGGRVLLVQFVKKGRWGSLRALERFGGQINVFQAGTGEFLTPDNREEQSEAARKGFDVLRKGLLSGEYGLVIADELAFAASQDLVALEDVLELIRHKPPEVEFVITGRYAPGALVDAADLVTEMREIKHYYQKGTEARQGIEF